MTALARSFYARPTLSVLEELIGKVLVEMKAVEELSPVHATQVITYLKLAHLPVGLLINFNAPTVKQGLVRFDHPDRYRPRKG